MRRAAGPDPPAPSRDSAPASEAPTRGRGGSRWLWPTVIVAVAGFCAWVGASAALAAVAGVRGPRPPFLDRSAKAPAPAPARDAGDVVLAGSGSNVPVTRALVDAFASARAAGCDEGCSEAVRAWIKSSAEIRVEASIGSTGAVAALLDGVIDVALISRPLTADEAKHDLVVHPYARSAVVACAHARAPRDAVSEGDLVGIYRGAKRTWSNGAPLVLLQREAGDPSHAAVARALDGFASAEQAARASGAHAVYDRDAALEGALLTTPGAFGLCDVGSITVQALPVTALAIGEVAPSEEALQSGRYRFHIDLAFVTRREPTGLTAAFFAFVRSEPSAEFLKQSGYMPLSKAPP